MRITTQKPILLFFTSAEFSYLSKVSKGNTFEFVSTAFNNLNLRNIFINKTKTVAESWNFNAIVQWAQSNILCLHCSAEIFILLCFFLGSRANKAKREFLQKLVSCPVLNFFPGFPQFTYTFIFIVRRLYGFVFLVSFQCVTRTGILCISGFAMCSNLINVFFYSK